MKWSISAIADQFPVSSALADGGRPSSRIRYVEADGLVVILDIANETYKVLDDAGSAFWRVLTGATSRDAACDRLQDQYAVDRETLDADYEAFRRVCTADGLLSDSDHDRPPEDVVAARAPPAWLPDMGAALMCLLLTQRTLKHGGFRTAYQQTSAAPRGRRSGVLDRVIKSFLAAENLFVARRAPDDCLVRSLALFRFLKLFDVAAHHVIGVRRLPFGAHAWVECDGAPVLQDNIHGFIPISRLA